MRTPRPREAQRQVQGPQHVRGRGESRIPAWSSVSQALQGLGSGTTAEQRNEQTGSEHESDLHWQPLLQARPPAARPRGRASLTSVVLLLPARHGHEANRCHCPHRWAPLAAVGTGPGKGVFPTPGAQEGSSHSRAGLTRENLQEKGPPTCPLLPPGPLSDSILSLHQAEPLGPAHLMAPATPLFPADPGHHQETGPGTNPKHSWQQVVLAGMGVQGVPKWGGRAEGFIQFCCCPSSATGRETLPGVLVGGRTPRSCPQGAHTPDGRQS